MHHNISLIGFQHAVEVEYDHGNALFVPKFRSNKFMKLILNIKLKPNILLQQLNYTNVFFDMTDAFRSIVSLKKRGFNVIAW